MKFSGLSRPDMPAPKKESFLEQALGAQSKQMMIKGLKMKHGLTSLNDKPMKPKGYATSGGGAY